MAQTRPNKQNLATKADWFHKAGGIIQFTLQLMQVRFPGLTSNFKMVLLAIMDRARPDGEGGTFAGLARIAQDAGVSRRTAIRAIQYWKDHGVLTWTPKHGLHRNEYTLLLSPMLLRVAVTVKIDVQSAKLALAKVPDCHFEQCQIVPLSHQRVSHQNVTGFTGRSPGQTGDGVTDWGNEPGETAGSALPPNSAHPPSHPHLDKIGSVGFEEMPQDASDGVGTAPTTTPAVLTRLAGSGEAVQAVLEGSGSELEGDMSYRMGGYNMSKKAVSDPRTGEDAMAKAEKTETKYPVDGFRVWGHMKARAKEKMGLDLPDAQFWEAKMLQKLVKTGGYGVDVVLGMVDTLTDNWAAVRENLKIKDDVPTVKLLLFKAAELKGAKGRMLGKGVNWASPDVGEEARKAVEKCKAERLAQKAKLAGGVA